MRKILKYIPYLLLSATFTMVACEDNPMDNEQYFKQIYLVGAAEKVKPFNINYGSEPQQAYISLGTGGSLNIDQDVKVTVGHAPAAIDWYNNKYMFMAFAKYIQLDPSCYEIPSMSTIIPAGQTYSRLPFSVKTAGLSPDSLYSLTFKIESVSHYQKNNKDTVLILNLNLTNKYSGTYSMVAVKYEVTTVGGVENLRSVAYVSTLRNLKAVSENSVRFFNELKPERASSSDYEKRDDYYNALKAYAVTFTVGANGTATVAPWDNLDIVNPGECVYADNQFIFWYDYMDGGKQYRLQGTMTK